MSDLPEKPLTRKEQLLSAIAGANEGETLPEPVTREEQYLKYIAENGSGGGGGGADYVKNGMNNSAVSIKSESETGIRVSKIFEVQVGPHEWTELEEILGNVTITKTGEDTAKITIWGAEIDLSTLALKWVDVNAQPQPMGGGVLARDATTGAITVSDAYATKTYVDDAIASIVDGNSIEY